MTQAPRANCKGFATLPAEGGKRSACFFFAAEEVSPVLDIHYAQAQANYLLMDQQNRNAFVKRPQSVPYAVS